MNFFKKLFKDDDRIIGLSGFKNFEEVRIFIPKQEPSTPVFNVNYKKNIFLM